MSRLPFSAQLATLSTLSLAASIISGGCEITRPGRNDQEISVRRTALVQDLTQRRIALSRRIVGRMLSEVKRQEAAGAGAGEQAVFDTLIISGGGDYGAFGAGVLKGWGAVQQPQMKRPVFDMVTGVSTGALIAPFAHAGTEEAYERAFQLYQDPKPDWFEERGIFRILFQREAFADNAGLRHEVQKAIDMPVLAEIARGTAENRPLVIGTTNLDMGLMVMWDVDSEAQRIVRGEATRDRFDQILIASTAIPGAFPPVEIDGDLYVDGGVTRNIAYTTDQDYAESSVNMWEREYPNVKPPKVRFWVIINNQLGTSPRSLQPGWPALMKRSLEMSVRSSTIGSLKALSLAMENLRLRGSDVEFRFIAIPDDWRPPVEGTFKKETMTDLAQLGFRLGSDPSNWKITVPNPESP